MPRPCYQASGLLALAKHWHDDRFGPGIDRPACFTAQLEAAAAGTEIPGDQAPQKWRLSVKHTTGRDLENDASLRTALDGPFMAVARIRKQLVW